MKKTQGIAANIILFIIVGLLAASTAYFFLQSQEKTANKSATSQITPSISATPSPSGTATPTPKPTASSATQPASSSNRPSNPAETYTVGQGETLFIISQKLNITWTTIAAVNNIANADTIKEKQVLIIPTADEQTKKLYVAFQVDAAKAEAIQQKAAADPTSVYLDPAKTAKNDAPPIYGITAEDTYTLESGNEYEGTAIIAVTHADKTYKIYLTQPVKKGKDGIWAISKIQPQ